MAGRRIVLKVELDEEEYRALEAVSRSLGYELPSQLVASLVKGVISGKVRTQQSYPALDPDAIARRLRRVIEDILNPYTAKIDEILRRISSLQESLEEALSRTPQVEPERAPQPQPPPPPQHPSRGFRGRTGRRTAMDRLKEDGILVASEARWINDPERFFSHLERQGAVVVRLSDDMVAVHPDFWSRFKKILEETAVKSWEDVEALLDSSLGEAAVRLFRLLRREGLVYYDEEEARWVVEAG